MNTTGGNFQLGENIDAADLCDRYGCPLYVYDTSIIARQYARLKSAFTYEKTTFNFACKALTNINILKFVNSIGAGIDTVSIQEVKIGLQAGFPKEDIIYTPNCVSLEEIEAVAQLGVKINIDNLSILEQFGQSHPDYPVCVRINPHIMAGGNSKIMTGHIDSKFGISVHQLPHIHRIVEATGITIEGLHMHTGSDILDADVFLYAAEILFNAAKEFKNLQYLDFGSGFKVPYKSNGIETNIEELGAGISERFAEFCAEYGRELTMKFEPGKYLVSESGYFLVKANVVKQTTSTVFVGVDSGLNHLIRPMFYNAHHEIVNVSKPGGKMRFYTVVGYICETDTFGVNRRISEISEGDILCFMNAGAYCFSMASNYNSRYRPAEVMIHDGESYLIRERESMEDIMRKQVQLDIF
jgi:diaminopimelate decarboxylase